MAIGRPVFPPGGARSRLHPGPIGEASVGPELAGLFRARGAARHVPPGGTISWEGEPADLVHLVIAGVVRCCRHADSGRRQVARFALPGDALGLCLASHWRHTNEAVGNVVIAALSRSALEAALLSDGALRDARRVWLAEELDRSELALARRAQLGAVAHLRVFLDDLSRRIGRPDGSLALEMTRQDIADHLGLSLETVSRGFSELRRRGDIVLDGPDRVRILPTGAAAPGRN